MEIHEWLQSVPRPSNSYRDFYPAAALFHAGLVEANTLASQGRPPGAVSDTIKGTAEALCQMTLPKAEFFLTSDGLRRESWSDAGFTVNVTADGLLKLDEQSEKAEARRFAILLAILASLVASVGTAYFESVFR